MKKVLSEQERVEQLKNYVKIVLGEKSKGIWIKLIRDKGEKEFTLHAYIESWQILADSFTDITKLAPFKVNFTGENYPKQKVIRRKGPKNKYYLSSLNENAAEGTDFKNYGVFPYINSGGTNHSEIEENGEVNSHYLDFDFKYKYYYFDTAEEALTFKLEQESNSDVSNREIKEDGDRFEVVLTMTEAYVERMKIYILERYAHIIKYFLVLDTRNGLHVYLPMDQEKTSTNAEEFAIFQHALFELFDDLADTQVVDIVRVLRFPGFYHLKEDPYMVTIRSMPESLKRFTREEAVELFGLDMEKAKNRYLATKKRPSKSAKPSKDKGTVSTEKTALNLVRKTDYEKASMSMNKFKEWIKQQPIDKFFEGKPFESDMFCCHFHNDAEASSHIHSKTVDVEFYDEETGEIKEKKETQYSYKCYGHCHKKTRDIIEMVQELQGIKYSHSIKKLAKLCNVKIEKSEFEIDQIDKFNDNEEFLDELVYDLEFGGELSDELTRYLKSETRRVILELMNKRSHLQYVADEYQYEEDTIFFWSAGAIVQYYETRHGGFFKKQTEDEKNRMIREKLDEKTAESIVKAHLQILTLLGFIKRVPLDKVPTGFRERAELQKEVTANRINAIRKAKGQAPLPSKVIKEINFYAVPNFNDAIHEAEAMVEKVEEARKERNFAFRILTKDSLTATFGEEIANRVFPNEEEMESWKKSIATAVQKYIKKEVSEKGYCFEADILEKPSKFRYSIEESVKDEKTGKYVKKKVQKKLTNSKEDLKNLNTIYRKIVMTSLTSVKRRQINDEIVEKYSINLTKKQSQLRKEKKRIYVWVIEG